MKYDKKLLRKDVQILQRQIEEINEELHVLLDCVEGGNVAF